MQSLRVVRRFGTAHRIAAAPSIASKDTSSIASNTSVSKKKPIKVDEPALIRLKKERDPEKLFNLFRANAHNKVVVENRFAFQDTVSRLAGAGRFDYIENLLEQQKTLPQGRREGFVVRIIMLYGSAGMVKHAIDTFYNMHLYGCHRTVKSLNAALKVLTLSRDPEAIDSFLKDVSFKFSISLDIFSINIIVKAFCEMGILDKAYLVMAEMEKLGISPDVVTYTTLISAFYRINRVEVSNGLWNLMVLKGCMPNLATFNVRIQFLVNRGRAWDANKLLDLMHRLGIAPDEITYNLVIKGFCRAGFLDMAKRVHSSLHGNGLKSNEKIYQTMIHYLCKAGEFNLAYTMCKDSMKNNWFPSVDSIIILLEGLQRYGGLEGIEKARFLITLAKRRVPPFSADQLKAMQSILSK
ncbi:pentatricopeptide repeat-containing protein At1g80150, mitochondrial [Ipomoea triloba]|uniref:pentatricopeptide repeat-containing protein At1g80150, mitochondrial n=1 Tax=Ipomoea triloba TaxID=35885 RepID=UPI00125DA9F4|nr:pentatricopeptide repeat-containing protein At1g80150, mitochondrial [Ipomoea triloba]